MQPMKKQREKCAHNCFHSKDGNALSLIELIFAKVISELLIPVSCCVCWRGQEAHPSQPGREPSIQPIIASCREEQQDRKDYRVGKRCSYICAYAQHVGPSKTLSYGPDAQ